MPIDYKRYPYSWPGISKEIRQERAENRCECSGVCGMHESRCTAMNGEPHPVTGSKVVLTVAHLGIDKADGRPGDKNDLWDIRLENLMAMCQRCHLLFDLHDHVRNRAINKRNAEIEAGQIELFGEKQEGMT
jgi:hypothetical protein